MDILVHGACGRLGSELCRLLRSGYAGCRLAGAVDIHAASGTGVLQTLGAFSGKADVAVDFSHHSAVGALCDFCQKRSMPLVLATTGHTPVEQVRIRQAAQHIPLFLASNLSLGIALLQQLMLQAAAALPQADIEIVETHHRNKKDAPSGTALQLAQALSDAAPTKAKPAVHALRLGSWVGQHSVMLAFGSETITLTHTAQHIRIYAEGAVRAAGFLHTQPPGLYGMPQLIDWLAQQKEQL